MDYLPARPWWVVVEKDRYGRELNLGGPGLGVYSFTTEFELGKPFKGCKPNPTFVTLCEPTILVAIRIIHMDLKRHPEPGKFNPDRYEDDFQSLGDSAANPDHTKRDTFTF